MNGGLAANDVCKMHPLMKVSFYDGPRTLRDVSSIDDFLSKTIMYGINGRNLGWKNGYGMEWMGFGKRVINNDEMQNMDLLLLRCFL